MGNYGVNYKENVLNRRHRVKLSLSKLSGSMGTFQEVKNNQNYMRSWWTCTCNYGCAHLSGCFFCICVSLSNINRVHLSNFTDEDTKCWWQMIWTGLWDSGPSFLDSNPLLSPLHRTKPQNENSIWIYVSCHFKDTEKASVVYNILRYVL